MPPPNWNTAPRTPRSRSPKFLIDAAGAAIAAGHYGAGMADVRQAIPQLEARRVAGHSD